MNALITAGDGAEEFLISPLTTRDSAVLSPEAGFCDGCSGCSVKISGRTLVVTGDDQGHGEDEFVVQPLAVPASEMTAVDSWCSGCKGCSAACRARVGS